jgi:hypothetical protein
MKIDKQTKLIENKMHKRCVEMQNIVGTWVIYADNSLRVNDNKEKKK